jgi:hypothetical protein
MSQHDPSGHRPLATKKVRRWSPTSRDHDKKRLLDLFTPAGSFDDLVLVAEEWGLLDRIVI